MSASNQPPPYPGEDPWASQQPDPGQQQYPGQQSYPGQQYPGQQYPGQQPYAGQGQQYPPAGGQGWVPQPKHPQAVTILVLGILGFLLCQVLGPIAWIMGNKAIREFDSQPGRWSGRSELNAGRILGIVATVVLILSILGLLAIFALFGVIIASDPDAWSEIESTSTALIASRF